MDKVNKAFDDAFDNNPAVGEAFRALTEREGYRDFLTHLRFMVIK